MDNSPNTDSDGFALDELCRLCNVSHETLSRLAAFAAILDQWRGKTNLIGPKERSRLWRRHIGNSLELLPHIHSNDRDIHLLDLGSGAGFPGLVLACALSENQHMTLLEANIKRVAFLRAASHACGLDTRIIHSKIEAAQENMTYDYVLARALAPLPKLLDHAKAFMSGESIALFLKGREAQKEIEDAAVHWSFGCKIYDNRFGGGVVLAVTNIEPRQA